ncbi:MAG: hypothetical protein E7549_08565 [Ruminococcaceae bacterium]|nr:hypothetical protein [Oscillospiraceae bacterium]
MKRRFIKWMALCLAIVVFAGAMPMAKPTVNAEEESEWVIYQKGYESRFAGGTTAVMADDNGLSVTVPAGQYMQFTGSNLNIDLPQGMAKGSFKLCARVYIPDEASLSLFTEGGGQFEIYNTRFDLDEISWNTATIAETHTLTVGWNEFELLFADADDSTINMANTIKGCRFYAGVGATKSHVRSLIIGEIKIVKLFNATACRHETLADGNVLSGSTCTEPGEVQTVCTLCGTVTGTKPLPLAACRYGAGKVTVRPTMDAKGVREFKCLSCDRVKFEEVDMLTGLGDVNGDRKIDSTDARLVLQYAVEKIETLDIPKAADVDKNGEIDSTDARLILQFAIYKIDELPAERTWQSERVLRDDRLWGINGHHKGYAAYKEANEDEILQLAADMGCNIYRFNYNPVDMNGINYVRRVANKCHALGMQFMLVLDNYGGSTQDIANRMAFTARHLGDEIEYFQIFNETDIYCSKSDSGGLYNASDYTGISRDYYNPRRVEEMVAKMTAALTAFKAENPTGKIVVNFGRTHITMMDFYIEAGLSWDVMAIDNYEVWNDKGWDYYDYFRDWEQRYPDYEFMIAECNYPFLNGMASEEQQAQWLDTFLRKMNDYPSDKFLGVIIYELLDQPDYEKQLGRYHGESHFGLVNTDANNNPTTPKAAYYHVQKLLGVYKGEG